MNQFSIHTQNANLSEEQFFMLCSENRDLRFERDKNKNIILMAPTFSLTGKFNSSLNFEVELWNKKQNSGFVFDSSAGFTLPNTAVRAADLAWIAKARWEELPIAERKKFAHICPDFVIELMSESDSLKELKAKMQEWIDNGCRLAWLIDVENKTTYIYKPNSEITEMPFTATLSGEEVLVGFELKLDEIIN